MSNKRKAPGGMKQQDLITELATEHVDFLGPEFDINDLSAMKWPDLINLTKHAREWGVAKAASEKAENEKAEEPDMSETVTIVESPEDMEDEEIIRILSEAKVRTRQTLKKKDRETLVQMLKDHWDSQIDAESTEDEAAEVVGQPREFAPKDEWDVKSALLTTSPDTWDFTFDGHAGAGPSGASRWTSCTASLAASREFLETLTDEQQAEFALASTAARQGTTAHSAGEIEIRYILGEITKKERKKALKELTKIAATDEAYTEEMGDHVSMYVDLVKQYIDDGQTVHVEQKLHAPVLLPDGSLYVVSGSGDALVDPTKKTRKITVIDLKYGDGVYVDAEENSQLRTYGLGSLARFIDDEGNLPSWLEEIEYVIVQPRAGGVKVWSEPVNDLLTWRDTVLAPALAKALAGPEGGAEFVPSESACEFCPAQSACSALAEKRIDGASDLFAEDISAQRTEEGGVNTTLLSDDRLGDLLAQGMEIAKLIDALKGEAKARLLRGDEVKNFHLVNYQPPRTWKPNAEERFADDKDLWKEPEMVSPTQALKEPTLVKDNERIEMLNEWIDKPDASPVVALTTDRRTKWEPPTATDLFPDDAPKKGKKKGKKGKKSDG